MDEHIFAGIDFSSGRQPVTFAALDDSLNIVLLEKYEITHIVVHLKQYSKLTLALGVPSSKSRQGSRAAFMKNVPSTGLKPFGAKAAPKQWFETDTQECFRALLGKLPLSRRTLEGRVQRGLILYEQGVRITDPMDFFEELTRHHMLGGVFPHELLNSAPELDALAAAYLAWLAINEPEQVRTTADKLIIPKPPERD